MNLKPLEHLAIIMDGNGRWASLKRKPRVYGHVKGTKVAKQIITDCYRLGIKHVTLYPFSTENWFRPQAEVSFLMNILRRYLKRETSNLIKENIKFSIIGDMNRLPKDVVETVKESMLATSHCTGLNLVFAISYGSQQEITPKRKEDAGKTWSAECLEIVEALPQKVYISFDIDGLDPRYCPNTGTPVPGGLDFFQATELIRAVAQSGRTIIGFDLNEVAPGPAADWDANVGARLLWQMACWTGVSQGWLVATSERDGSGR